MCLEQNYFCGPFANYIPGTMASSSGYADVPVVEVAPQDTNLLSPSKIYLVTPTMYIRVG